MSFFGFGQTADIEIVFDDADRRKVVELKNSDDGKKDKHLLYYDGETVSGKVNVTVRKPGTKLEHQGIKVELIGQIELYYDRGNHHEFISLVKELARPGDLLQHTSYSFEFANVEKPYEVYSGSNVRLRYFVRATVVRRLTDIVREVDIAVHTLCSYPDVHNSIKMEVGIEDCLHIEFEYNKSKYHLRDVIVGKIYFLLVRIKIKHMEISIIKRETTGASPNTFTENETVAKYEIMDGAPVRGESIPIRVFLAGYELTPTMRDVNNKFSVRYYLNLVLMDTEDRRYFKQQEVTLWRRSDRVNAVNRMVNAGNPSHLVGAPQPRRSPSAAPGADPLAAIRDSPGEHGNPLDDKENERRSVRDVSSKDSIKQFISESASTDPLDTTVEEPANSPPRIDSAENDLFGANDKISTVKSNTAEEKATTRVEAVSEVPARTTAPSSGLVESQ